MLELPRKNFSKRREKTEVCISNYYEILPIQFLGYVILKYPFDPDPGWMRSSLKQKVSLKTAETINGNRDLSKDDGKPKLKKMSYHSIQRFPCL